MARRRFRSVRAAAVVFTCLLIVALGYLVFKRFERGSEPAPAPTVSAPPPVTEQPTERPTETPASPSPSTSATSERPDVPLIETSRDGGQRGGRTPAPSPGRAGLPPTGATPREAETVRAPAAPPIQTEPAETLPGAPAIRTPESITGVAPSAPLPGVVSPEPSRGATPAKVFDSESAALASIVKGYELAYDRLDAAAAAVLWPSVDERALARAFARLQMQNLEFGECTFAVSQNEATAQCAGLLQYARRIGDTAPKSERHVWTIEFVRMGGDWRIVRITAQ